MEDVLKSVFVAAETVFVAMDLLGAARALLGQSSDSLPSSGQVVTPACTTVRK